MPKGLERLDKMNNFLKALLFAVIALAGIVASTVVANKFKEPIPVEIVPDGGKIQQLVTCPKDFSGFDSLPKQQVVELIDKKVRAYASNGRFINPTIVVAKRGGLGSEVACGYLYVKTGTESAGSLRDWENVYINPNPLKTNPYGGHIQKDKSISNKNDGQSTEMIFSLENINYKPNKNSSETKSANWVALMNVSDLIEFNISLNTEDKSGFIEKILIGYRCFNPETLKETNDCRFDVVERKGL